MPLLARHYLESRLLSEETRRVGEVFSEVREGVLNLTDDPRFSADLPSDYWTTELETFEHLLDVSPLLISKLRHHTEDITGLCPFYYRHGTDAEMEQFRAKKNALTALVDRDLLSLSHLYLAGLDTRSMVK
jgi:hypothetical protein